LRYTMKCSADSVRHKRGVRICGLWTIGGSLNSDLDRWGTRSISVRIARTDGGSVPRCSCILPHLANSQWRGKIDSREESSRARGFLSQAARSSLLHLSRCWDRAARMEPIGPLGALRSTDRWNQVSVDPIEGPLPEHVGAEQPGAVSWASAADRQRARSFSARASFGRGTSPGLARSRRLTPSHDVSRREYSVVHAQCLGEHTLRCRVIVLTLRIIPRAATVHGHEGHCEQAAHDVQPGVLILCG
jgi:hypothetical protein